MFHKKAATLSADHIWLRYWLCIWVLSLVVAVRAAMVIVWATRLDHKWTFKIDRISFFTYMTTFVANV